MKTGTWIELGGSEGEVFRDIEYPEVQPCCDKAGGVGKVTEVKILQSLYCEVREMV